MKRFILLAWWLLAVVAGYAQAKDAPYVILVSFDGFRYDYVAKYNPPNFKKFIAAGAQAEAIIPSFPSKTFPNHYSIVTGMNPGNHGLVDNSFYDRARNEFYGMSNKERVVNPYYYGGVPLWELAKRNGMKSASYFWVGSELSDENRRPDYYYPFDDRIDPSKRVQQVIDWLKLPAAERPHLITLYFSFPDHEGHNFGPNAPETGKAVLRADSLLGTLMEGVKSTRLPVNVILVSDHGMKEIAVKESSYIFVDELIDRNDQAIKVVNNGTHTHVYIDDTHKRDSLYTLLKQKEKNFTVLRKEDYPPRWHYQNDRVGDLLLKAKPGYYLRTGSRARFLSQAKLGTKVGEHGYDPGEERDIYGVFYAQGPNIKKGAKIEAFQNIHVYPLIVKILGLPLPPIDGKEEVLIGIYRK
ncbi:MAG: alkaline phosphatase family protein [Cyclobacteriaceae bacterium]|nr:alkaline phosphatase family protein [Cyclobacteriaceae bacterium]